MFAQMYSGVGVETACALLIDMSGGAPAAMVESMTCVVIAVYLAGVLCRMRAAGVWAVLKDWKQRLAQNAVQRVQADALKAAIGAKLGALVRWMDRVLVAGRFTRRFAPEHQTYVNAVLASIYGFTNRLLDFNTLRHAMIWGTLDIPTSLWLASNPEEAERFALGAITAVPDVVPGTSSVSDGSPSKPATPVHTDEYDASVAIEGGEVLEQTETGPSKELPMKPDESVTTPEAMESKAKALLECKPADGVEYNADAEDDTEDDTKDDTEDSTKDNADSVYESADEFGDGEEDGEVEKKGKDVGENNNKEPVESRIDLNAMLASLVAMSLESEEEDAISEHDAKPKTPSATSSGQLGTTTFALVDAPAAMALSTTASSLDVAEMADSTPEVEDTMKDVRDAEQETAIAIEEKVEAHIGTTSCTPITAVVTVLVSAPVEEHPRASQNDNSLADEPSQQAEHADKKAIARPRLSLPNKNSQPLIHEAAVFGTNVPTEYKEDKDGEHEKDNDNSTLTLTIWTILTNGSAPTTYPVVNAAATAATLTTPFNFVDRIFEEFMAELAADAIALEKKMAEWAATEWQVLALKGPACTPKVK
ncbi:hypothetical protein FRC07_007584, partial [Ceratobasidium sp. 392]